MLPASDFLQHKPLAIPMRVCYSVIIGSGLAAGNAGDMIFYLSCRFVTGIRLKEMTFDDFISLYTSLFESRYPKRKNRTTLWQSVGRAYTIWQRLFSENECGTVKPFLQSVSLFPCGKRGASDTEDK